MSQAQTAARTTAARGTSQRRGSARQLCKLIEAIPRCGLKPQHAAKKRGHGASSFPGGKVHEWVNTTCPAWPPFRPNRRVRRRLPERERWRLRAGRGDERIALRRRPLTALGAKPGDPRAQDLPLAREHACGKVALVRREARERGVEVTAIEGLVSDIEGSLLLAWITMGHAARRRRGQVLQARGDGERRRGLSRRRSSPSWARRRARRSSGALES